jgi:hypothetical protein
MNRIWSDKAVTAVAAPVAAEAAQRKLKLLNDKRENVNT